MDKFYVERKKTLIIPTEQQECAAYWEWAQKIPVLRDYLYKIPNEGKRTPIYGSNLKKIGLQPGIPDYHYPVSNDKYHGLWLEMKIRTKKNKTVPDHQQEWIKKLNKIDHYATFAYGWEEAAKITMDYINHLL